MKYLLLITSIFIFIGCARQPLNVYSPHPVNTVFVKDDGDAGTSATYFANSPKQLPGEDELKSNGFSLQGKVVVYKGLFIESGTSYLKEFASKKRDSINPNIIIGASYSNTKYKNIEFGLGKIFKIGSYSDFIANVGFGNTKYNSFYSLNESNLIQNLNMSFVNNHIYWGVMYQYSGKLIKEQFGFKYNYTKFKNILTDNNSLYKDVISDLIYENSNFKSFLQVYQNFGMSPFKELPWLSMNLILGINFENNLAEKAQGRFFTSAFSIMASPSKILKRKK